MCDILFKNKRSFVEQSAYSKIEKGARAITVDELYKASQLFNMTTDQILAYDGDIPSEVVIEDKTAVEQLRLIQQLEEEDRLSSDLARPYTSFPVPFRRME